MEIIKKMDDGIMIVGYSDALAPAIAELFSAAREEWGGSTSRTTPEQVIQNHSAGANLAVFVAMDGERAVGYCSFSKYWKDAETAYVGLLDVLTEYHGRKIGKALVLLCVEKTRELGLGRIDLHTWPGNTKAVPLYKKCGFLWEDRGDTTHLVNFMPWVLSEPMFAGFFAHADWYENTTKNVGEIVPDEIRVNKFGLFGYTWEHGGEALALGFERSGRALRMIETNDYKIEMMAENHELAFGANYDVVFTITNKSGKKLDIQISGERNDLLDFDFSFHDENFTGTQEQTGKFRVGKIDSPQDKDRVHPCVAAKITLNGETVRFGMGIEIRFPLQVDLITKPLWLTQAGVGEERYLNIKSGLAHDARVFFDLPENNLVKFSNSEFAIDIPARGKASIPVNLIPQKFGHESLPINYNIKLESGDFHFTKPLHIVNTGFGAAFGYECDENIKVHCGAWQLSLDKESNSLVLSNILSSNDDEIYFEAPMLGKPFEDEFTLSKPEFSIFEQDGKMILEEKFVSRKFEGLVCSRVFSFGANGQASKFYRINNTANAPQPAHIMYEMFFPSSTDTAFHYNGELTRDRAVLSGVEPNKLTENWFFGTYAERPNFGVCWSSAYQASCRGWGDLYFELDCGILQPGDIFETAPTEIYQGIFPEFSTFRSFVCQKYIDEIEPIATPIQIIPNGHNPFVSGDSFELSVKNNRNIELEGDVAVSSEMFDSQSQHNPGGEAVAANNFAFDCTLPKNGIGQFAVDMSLVTRQIRHERALFFPRGEIRCFGEGSSLACANGALEFRADPAYSHGIYSIKFGGQEWLTNKYPNHEPYSWFSPFFGGIHTNINDLSTSMVLDEKITAGFAEISDNFGNIWKGIRITLEFSEWEERKGMTLHSYFLTLPGLPILCHFGKFCNNTGLYIDDEFHNRAYFDMGELTDTTISAKYFQNLDFTIRNGTAQIGRFFDKLMRVQSKRDASLYVYSSPKGMRYSNHGGGDNKTIWYTASLSAAIPNGKEFTTAPDFYIISDQNISKDALIDLERIEFYENN